MPDETAKPDPAAKPAPTPSTHQVAGHQTGTNDAAQGLGGHSKDVGHEKKEK